MPDSKFNKYTRFESNRIGLFLNKQMLFNPWQFLYNSNEGCDLSFSILKWANRIFKRIYILNICLISHVKKNKIQSYKLCRLKKSLKFNVPSVLWNFSSPWVPPILKKVCQQFSFKQFKKVIHKSVAMQQGPWYFLVNMNTVPV